MYQGQALGPVAAGGGVVALHIGDVAQAMEALGYARLFRERRSLLLENLAAIDQFFLEPVGILLRVERRVAALGQKRMRKRMALDVRAGGGHLFDLFPRERVRRHADDFRIDEQRERKMPFLQLRKRLAIRAAPAVVDRDRDGVLRQ